jgi:hypothetical protein
MTAANHKHSYFTVTYTYIIDFPERRGPSYPVYPAHTAISLTKSFSSRRHAVSFFNELASGEGDCASDFTCSVSCMERWPEGPCRTVRKRIERNPDGRKAASDAALIASFYQK